MNDATSVVMVVDDEAEQRLMTGLLLEEVGATVVEACSGEQAISMVQENLPDLVLLDFHMGGINGVETLLKLRKQFDDQKLPILMLSGHQDPDTIAYALDHGANDYISKLTHPKVLLARVRRHLHSIRLHCDPMPALGEFRLQKNLGKGPVFTAFLLEHPKFSAPLVAKILKPGFSLKTGADNLIAKIDHPGLSNIVALSTKPVDYILADYKQGQTLADLLSRGPLSERQAFELMLKLADVVAAIHQVGKMHLNLNPANIVVDELGFPFVLDFGLSELIVQENEVSPSGFSYGDVVYQSPEQLQKDGTPDTRSDLYSLGAVFFAMLTGVAPFRGLPKFIVGQVLNNKPPLVSELRADGSVNFDILLERLLAKNADERYPNIEHLLLNLREFGKLLHNVS